VTDPEHFADRIEAFFTKYLASFARGPGFEITDFLLPAMSPYWDEKCVGPERPYHSGGDAEWARDHTEAFADAKIPRPSGDTLKTFGMSLPIPAQGRWFLSRPVREQEMAYFWSMKYEKEKTGGEAFVDVSQSIKRAAPMKGQIGCFTSETWTWMIKARRFISGRERLAIQGMSKYSQVEGNSDDLAGNFAGNAFSAPCCMAATAACFVCA